LQRWSRKKPVFCPYENMRLNFGDSFPHTTLACDAVEYLKQIGDRYDLIILDRFIPHRAPTL